jgi:hypothetical protein
MDKQDIIRMAREAGFEGMTEHPVLERFAALVASRVAAAAVEQERKEFAVHAIDIARKAIEEEREACAKAAEDFLTTGRSPLGRSVAAAIRARGEVK